MDYRNGPRFRGSHPPRMPRINSGHPHQIQPQPRGPAPVMSSWQGNPINSYPNQEEAMTQYTQPAMDFPYLYNQTPEIPQGYTAYPQYCPMYPMDPTMYHQGAQTIPLAPPPAPTPPMVASPAPKPGDMRCPKCQAHDSFVDAELAKKEEEINALQQQLAIALAEINDLKAKLSLQTGVPEVGVSSEPGSGGPEEDASALATKVSQLSPDAIEFNPTKATDGSAQFPNASTDVPVVSAKGMNDDSSSEAPADLGDESQVEECLKTETRSEHASPSPSPAPSTVHPTDSAVQLKADVDECWGLPKSTVSEAEEQVHVKADAEESVDEDLVKSTVSEENAVGQQDLEENNHPAVADSDWADDEMSVKSVSAHSRHSPDNQFKPNFDKSKNNYRYARNDRKRDEHTNYVRGKYNHRRGDQEGYKSFNRGTNDRGGRFGNRNQYQSDNNDRYLKEQDQGSMNGPQNDNDYQSRDREDNCRGSTESLRDNRPFPRGVARRASYHYKDNYRQDREWNQDQQKGDGPNTGYRSRGGPRGRSHDGFDRHESNRRFNQSNGGSWRSPPPLKSEVKNIVQEVQADLFSAPPDVSLGHCVAKDFRMGSGIAVKFKIIFKRVPELLAQEVDVGGCAYIKDTDKDRYIFYLVTKPLSWGKPTYDTFKQSLEALKDKCTELKVTKLAIPRIGCGLDQLDWTRVKGMINETFQDLDIQITAYEFNASPNYYKKKQFGRNSEQCSVKKLSGINYKTPAKARSNTDESCTKDSHSLYSDRNHDNLSDCDSVIGLNTQWLYNSFDHIESNSDLKSNRLNKLAKVNRKEESFQAPSKNEGTMSDMQFKIEHKERKRLKKLKGSRRSVPMEDALGIVERPKDIASEEIRIKHEIEKSIDMEAKLQTSQCFEGKNNFCNDEVLVKESKSKRKNKKKHKSKDILRTRTFPSSTVEEHVSDKCSVNGNVVPDNEYDSTEHKSKPSCDDKLKMRRTSYRSEEKTVSEKCYISDEVILSKESKSSRKRKRKHSHKEESQTRTGSCCSEEGGQS